MPEHMLLKCLRGNVGKYPMVAVRMQVAEKCFCFIVGVVPQLDCLSGPAG